MPAAQQNALVLSHPLGSGADDELRDIHGYWAIEIPMWVVYAGVSVFVIALGWFIYWKFFRKVDELELTLFEKAVQALQALDLNDSSKTFYLEYSEITKNYLEQTLGLPVLERTAEEIKPLMVKEPKIQTSSAVTLSKIFLRADLAKFAKQEVDVDNKAQDIEMTIQILKSIEDQILAELQAEEEAKEQALEEEFEAEEEELVL